MKRKLWVILIGTAFVSVLPSQAQDSGRKEFSHRFAAGEQYRIVGINRQTVLLNDAYVGESEELIRVQTEVVSVEDGKATLRAVYQMSAESQGERSPFQLTRQFDVSFVQDQTGRMTVSRGEFVPQVRDVPLFPGHPISAGETWSAPASEVYDFREGFEVQSPVVVPMDVSYRYAGEVERSGKRYDLIEIRYNTFYRPSPMDAVSEHVRLITGSFSQQLYWDSVRGRPQYYEEDFSQFVQTRDGTRYEFRGSASGEIVESNYMDRNAMQQEIETALRDENIEGTTVRESDAGVIIAIEDIRFAPDSADLLDQEIGKLEFIGSILKRYGDRDVLITGHTALAGTERGRQLLSEERARTVGEFFIARGVRSRERLIFEGVGATQPVADNTTEEGRRKNRRVEITILEN